MDTKKIEIKIIIIILRNKWHKRKKIKPEIPFVMISGHGDLDTAVNTMRLGAYDYISKPPDLNRLIGIEKLPSSFVYEVRVASFSSFICGKSLFV